MQTTPLTVNSTLQKFNLIVLQTISYIDGLPKPEQEAFLKTEGLLRISASKSDIDTIYNAIAEDPTINKLTYYAQNKYLKTPHAVLSIMKRFLIDGGLVLANLSAVKDQLARLLADSTYNFKDLLRDLIKKGDKEATQAIHNIIYLGQRIVQYQDDNKMTADNVANILVGGISGLLYPGKNLDPIKQLEEARLTINHLQPKLKLSLTDTYFSRAMMFGELVADKGRQWNIRSGLERGLSFFSWIIKLMGAAIMFPFKLWKPKLSPTLHQHAISSDQAATIPVPLQVTSSNLSNNPPSPVTSPPKGGIFRSFSRNISFITQTKGDTANTPKKAQKPKVT